MTPFVVGTREDVVGFALAGVDGVICSSPDEVNQALSKMRSDQFAILSADFAECEKNARTTLIVVLTPRG
jgi:vacuolar-type H+-ATPase subunit F/Vma7